MLGEEAHISNFRRISDETAKDSGNNAEKLGAESDPLCFLQISGGEV
jgi:hypothetical protein